MKQMKKITNKGLAPSLSRGFTLIELLVVVAIIAILALIVMLAINPVEMARRSRDSRRLSDMATLRKAIDLALADNKKLPVNTTWITVNSATPVNNFGGEGVIVGVDIQKYLSAVPQDPAYDSDATATLQVIEEASGVCAKIASYNKNAMIYEFKSDGNVYVLRGRLESFESNCQALLGDGKVDDYYEIGTAPGLSI